LRIYLLFKRFITKYLAVGIFGNKEVKTMEWEEWEEEDEEEEEW